MKSVIIILIWLGLSCPLLLPRKDIFKNADFENFNALLIDVKRDDDHELSKNLAQEFFVTTKDRCSVKAMLAIEGIYVTDEFIYDKDDYKLRQGKKGVIESIMRREKASNAIFVDDNQEHLEKCAEIENLALCCADWGYVEPGNEKAMNMKHCMC